MSNHPAFFLAVSLTGAWLLIIFIALACAIVLWLLHRTRLGPLLHEHIPDRPKRRLFLASVSFLGTFAAVRALAWSIHNHIGPFHDVHMGGRHIHHLVWGILLLLLVGYGWLVEVGTGEAGSSLFLGRLMALLFGAGAALTLDEFALWLNLSDVYWAREGRASLDAIVIFGALLSCGVWGGAFIHALLGRPFSRKKRAK
jgi:uncharacterized membrane protein YfcA